MFERRAQGAEFLDRPDADPRLVEQSYRFMKVVNRIGGGIRVVRRFLAQDLAGRPQGQVVRILDLGAGDCDIPLAVTRWANKRGYKVQFMCLDHNPKAMELAWNAIAVSHCPTLRVERADIFAYRPADKFDYAVGSMVFHHFTDEEIDRLITHLRGFVRRALLINDLHRSALNYLVCCILALPLDPRIRHDALLSIRRGFEPAELSKMLTKHDAAPVVRRLWFGRIAGIVRFDRKEGE